MEEDQIVVFQGGTGIVWGLVVVMVGINRRFPWPCETIIVATGAVNFSLMRKAYV